MTFRSLTIEKHDSEAEATKAYNFEHKRRLLASLDAYAWPVSATRFAKARELPIDHVDNCWARIALNGAVLREFLQLGLGVDPKVLALANAVDDEAWYVIQDEEF